MQRQILKYNRDNLVITTYKKKNRRFWRKQLFAKFKEKKNRMDKQKKSNVRIKESTPDQNAINLTSTELSESQKWLLRKGPSFLPIPSDVNWYEVWRDFDTFVNQVSYRLTHSTEITSSHEILSEPPTAGNFNVIPNLPR